MTTELVELIKTTTRHGFAEEDMPIHEHTQLWTKDGRLVVELCDFTQCDTLEPPEDFV